MPQPNIKITQDEIEDWSQALKESPLFQAANILRAVVKAETTMMYIRTVSRDPYVFEVDLIGVLVDPLTGEAKEVKLGSLCVPELVLHDDPTPTDNTKSLRAPAGLH